MEKSILYMIGGEKYIKPHYDIKAENTSCNNLKGFTGIEVNGVRFSNLGEMLRYMNKQHEQLTKAKEIIRELLNSCFGYNSKTVNYEVKVKAEQFLEDVSE